MAARTQLRARRYGSERTQNESQSDSGWRRRQRRRDGGARHRRQGAGRRRHHRHRRSEGARAWRSTCSRRARSRARTRASSVTARPTRAGSRRPNSDVVVITSGVPRKPGMSRDDLLNDQLQDHAVGHRAGRQVLAEHDHRAGRQPARRDVPGGLPAERVPARARHRHGRRARFGADAHVHRDGAERLGRERPRVRARRPRRHDGAAAALLDGRRHSDHRAAARRNGSTRSASGPPTAAPRSRSWSARAPGTRRGRRRPRWSRRS